MASFHELCERIKPGQDLWDHGKSAPDLDEPAMSVIQRGLEIRPDRTDGKTFWDDFIEVIGNNGEGAAHLLGVNSEVISGWSGKIKKAMKKVREDNAPNDEKSQMTQTGDTNVSA